jgi:chromosome segregation ATPase
MSNLSELLYKLNKYQILYNTDENDNNKNMYEKKIYYYTKKITRSTQTGGTLTPQMMTDLTAILARIEELSPDTLKSKGSEIESKYQEINRTLQEINRKLTTHQPNLPMTSPFIQDLQRQLTELKTDDKRIISNLERLQIFLTTLPPGPKLTEAQNLSKTAVIPSLELLAKDLRSRPH